MIDDLVIERASSTEATTLLMLGGEHAVFEHLSHRASQRPSALVAALEGDSPLLHAWIARLGDRALGYASATLDFSTLDAAPYLHMDCLYVRDTCRGQGIGLRLWQAAHAFAQARRCAAIQWQTPWWNVDAARFYRRLGASETPKLRYCLPLDAD
jgi:GNAT superfamily N-acetyltransferase